MNLKTFFQENPRVALAFSGGCDSAYLLWAAKQAGCHIHAYFVKSAFQPRFELEHAERLAAQLELPLTVLHADVLSYPEVAANPSNRCYHCKKAVFGEIFCAAQRDGFSLVIDGTNASDDAGDRPGMQALAELEVRSPLRECGITKDQIRSLSEKAGLFTHDKPAYACLATRIPAGTAIDLQTLSKIECAEGFLFNLGFSDFRVRLRSDGALLQFPEEQLSRAFSQREEILTHLSPLFSYVALDFAARKRGN